ncbi:Pleiotropic drug resistance protein 1 [Spatholobus suberectus]|nr:Pleiotropic drug resistance protein 1 [Spatholobus suberectus]
MESGELRVASARIGSSSVWRSSGVDVFSGSSRRDDDEQELKWAAIEKLPTYLRMTRGILTEAEGQPTEIDINKLCPLQRKNLVERLVKIAEQDNEKFLLKLRDRIDRVGLEIPTIEVRFEHLNIEAEAHVGSRALPTIFNFCINLLEGFLNSLHLIPSRKKPFTVLHDVSGIIKPKRMTLLLGPPSSGKTTLLLALAGRLEMLAELSRREKAANIKPEPDLDIYMKAAALEGQETNVVTDYIMKILGLEVCADTMVGDDMIRGISGGQKKRVTTGKQKNLLAPHGRFIKQYFLLVCINQMASGLFRFMGAVGRNIIVANTVGSFALLAVMSYVLFESVDVKKWWLWGYWFSPMMYGQNALAVNEFLGKSWSHVPPNSTEPLGVKVLKSRGIFPEAYWYWIGVGASIGYMLLFNFLFPLALHYLDPFGTPQALISEEALAERNAGRNEHVIELSPRFKGSSGGLRTHNSHWIENRRSVSSRTLSARVGSIGAIDRNRKRGMVLPFTPLSITFDEIRYAVDMPQEKQELDQGTWYTSRRFQRLVLPHKRMPVWWRWYFWICPVSWTLYGLVTSQFGDIKERIETGETVEEFVRSYFGYRDDFIGIAAAVLVGFTLLFGFTFAFSIKAFNFQKR